MTVSWRPLRDLLLIVVSAVVGFVGFANGDVPLMILAAAIFGAPALLGQAPLLRPDPAMPEGQRTGCVCRGCVRPGQRTLWERLRRRPMSSVPRSHAQEMLGIPHGRLHDARRMEAEAGMEHSPEVIAHFALPPERWREEPDDIDAFADHFPGGCHEEPELLALSWR